MRFLSTPTVLALATVATLASACAEFIEEGSEAVDTLSDPNATSEEIQDEVGEAAKSVLPGEQKEGDIDLRIEALDDALQDLELAIEKLDKDEAKKRELGELKQIAAELEAEAERAGQETSAVAQDLLDRIDTALGDIEAALEDVGSDA